MLRRSAFMLLSLVALALPLLVTTCRARERPHVVLIVIDSLRARHLGCYGYAGQTSPEIDRLAQEGVLFEQAIAVGGNTTTSMSSLFTGQYTFFEADDRWGKVLFGMNRFGQAPGTMGLPDSMTTLAEYLSAAGYQTAGFVTNPYVGPRFHMQQGFGHYEDVFDEHGSSVGAGRLTRLALRYASELDWRKPTLLYLHLMDTHVPYRKPDDVALAALPAEARALSRAEATGAWSELRHGAVPGGGRTRKPGEREALRRYITAAYDSSIRRADRAVGRIRRFLEDRGLADRTMVIVTADHGDEFLEHGGTLHMGTLYEEIVHVPLVLRVPGGPRGVRRSALVRSFDVTATILDYAGIAAAIRPTEARSLRTALEGGALAGPREAYAAFPSVRMLRTERYKLLRYRDGREALFDLRRDPREQRDLAPSTDPAVRRVHRSLARRLDQTVARLRAQRGSASGATRDQEIDETTRERLRTLGYVDE